MRKHFTTTDLPLNLIPLVDSKHVLVATSGYNKHNLYLVDISGQEAEQVPAATTRQSWYGLALDPAAFAEGREPTPVDVRFAIAATTPVAKPMKERIEALREWSKGRAREAGAGQKSTPATPSSSRRVQPLN